MCADPDSVSSLRKAGVLDKLMDMLGAASALDEVNVFMYAG